MNTIQSLSEWAQVSTAAYAAGLEPSRENRDAYTAQTVGMSPTQANTFDAAWAVIEQSSPDVMYGMGFSAVLLQRKDAAGNATGEKVLAIAGTDPTSGKDLITDLISIVTVGTVAGMWQYEALENFYYHLKSTGKIAMAEQVVVAGHSLGGFLAQAFTVRHPEAVSVAYTYNAPGFGDLESLQRFVGITSTAAESKITNVVATDGLDFTVALGTHKLGATVGVRIEVSAIPTDNHSMVRLGDALAVQAAYAQLQPSLSTTQAGALFSASGLGERRLEDALDALRRSVLGLSAARTATGDRDAVYTGLKALSDSAAFQSLSGQVRLSPVGANLGVQARARVDFQSLVAMQTLSPFVIDPAGDSGQAALTALWQSPAWSTTYAAWQADQASIAAGGEPQNFSDHYLLDRAGLLVKLAELNTKNLDPLLAATTAWQGRNVLFLDADSGARVAAGALPSPATAYDVVAFGKYSDDLAGELSGGAGNDRLYGLGGDDWLLGYAGIDYLEGNAGNDTLDGGAGNDQLLGGKDYDTYTFSGAWGNDTIIDSDGQGRLQVEGFAAGLPQGKKGANGKYQSADGQVTYTVVQISPTRQELHIEFVGRNDTITIGNWGGSGTLGINLDDNVAPLVPNYVSGGDQQSNPDDLLTAFYDPDGGGPIQGSYVSDVRLSGGAGNDIVLGWSGSDILEGGVDADVVLGEGGAYVGASYVPGDPGDDRIYADTEIDLEAAIAQGATQTPSGLKGDWLDGQDGNDAIVGSAGNDVLMGGRGADILVGGAGDDELNGDDDYAPANSAPWSVSAMPGNEFDRLYSPVISYNRADDLGAGDILYGGAGNDHLLGGIGDDVLYGEADNDTLAGGDNDDIVLGGTGNDRLSGDFGQSTTSTGRIVVQGDDYLDGGAGNDFLQGEGGNDQLFGGSGDDDLWGDAKTYTDPTLNGDDLLDGGDGNDNLVGQGGADTLFGGTGNDSLFGDADDVAAANQGNDSLDGGEGNDYLRGYGGDDLLSGGSGNDQLLAEAGDDYLDGGAGADTLDAGQGNDVLIGGADIDVLNGGPGDDTYVFNVGDGTPDATGHVEAIDDSEGRNAVVFTDAWASSLTVQDDGAGNLIIGYSASDRVAVIGGVAGSVASYQFSDGQSLTAGELVGQLSATAMSATDAQGHLVQLGGAGDDNLAASTAFATLSGGRGADILSGSGGNDTYLYSPGDGADRIIDTSAKTDAQGQPAPNRIVFGAGIAPSAVRLSHAGGDLVLSIGGAGSGDIIRIAGFDAANALGTPAIDSFVFNDGTVLGYAQLLAQGFDLVGTSADEVLQGTSVVDRFDGGAGNDTMRGGAGSDAYSFGNGSGQDVIDDGDSLSGAVDTLRIGSTLSPPDLQLLRRGNDLLVGVRGTADQVSIVNQFAGAGIEQITFGDGTTWDAAAITAHVTNELTDGSDVFTGTNGDDSIDAKGGDDVVSALGGADFIEGGGGNDTLSGGDGNDTLSGGAGNDLLVGGQGADVYRFALGGGSDVIDDQGSDGALDVLRLEAGITPQGVKLSGSAQITLSIVGSADSIRFAGPDAASAGKIERIEFADGTVWTEAQWAQRVLDDAATGGSDSITGFASTNDTLRGLDGNDMLWGLAGNDLLDGGAGFDTLDGGAGDDVLLDGEVMNGGAGNDTYRLNGWTPNVNNIVISEVPDAAGNVDVLYLPPGVSPASLDVRPSGAGPYDDLQLTDKTTGKLITVPLYFSSPGDDYKIEQIRFADGTVWSVADVFAKAAQTQMTAGDDTVLGFRWNDTLDGQAGNDLIVGSTGDDQLFGGAGDDNIYADGYTDVYAYPSDGNDSLDGGAGNDTLHGGGGNDSYLFGRGRGSDTIFEVGGVDRILLDAGVQTTDVNLFRVGTDLILAVDQGPTQLLVAGQFSGTASKMIESIEFADGTVWDATQIQARAVGGTPNAMVGTAGNDTFVVDDPGDTITEAPNQGTDTVQSSVGYALGDNLENLTLTGYLNVYAIGNTLNNVITGNAGNNVLKGAQFAPGGQDTLVGGAGDDTYYVDGATGAFSGDTNSDDTVIENAGQGVDTIITSTLNFTLPANVENLKSTSMANRLSLTGNGLDNVLDANQSNGNGATFDGGPGADTMRGTFGNDTYVVDNVGDVIVERGFYANGQDASRDTVRSSVTYALGTGLEDLTLTGSAAISGTGNSRDNVLDGSTNSAANALAGGGGNDTYRLGNGDSVVEHAGEGVDTVVLVQGAVATYSVATFANVENLLLEDGLGASGLLGDSGANRLTGNGSDNVLSGGDGDDVILDSAALRNDRDTLLGGAGNDRLTSNSGADWLDGGAGNDALIGSGDVTVVFGRGYGADSWTATGANANRRVLLNPDLQLGDLVVSRDGADMLLSFGQGDGLRIVSCFVDASSTAHNGLFGALEFADGTRLDAQTLIYRMLGGNSNVATAGADVMFGTGSADMLDGLAGDDRIISGGGDDDLTGGVGNDLLMGGTGNDVYRFERGAGQDTIVESGGTADSIWLAPGIATADVVVSRSGADLVIQVDGPSDQVTVSGFFGASASEIESLHFADGTAWDSTMLKSLAVEIHGTAGNDVLQGSNGDDRIYGFEGNDTLTGLNGNDLLDGGPGADSMAGGAGDDIYVVDSASDVVTESAGEGNDTIQSSVTIGTLAVNVENLTLSGAAAINGTGNTLANVIRGNAAANTLNGGAGADTLIGGAGDDIYVVDNAGDVVTELAGEGTDLVQSSVTYTLSANVENLTLTGTSTINAAGNELDNVLTGNSANNTLTGGAGNDLLDGGTGNDTMKGGLGDDTYVVNVSTDVVTENTGEGTDTVKSSVTLTLANNVENLTLTGTNAINGTGNGLANVLTGNSAKNTLSGGVGNDTLDGAAGADTLAGGTGNDTYVLGRGYGAETVQENDKTTGNTDVMQFLAGVAIDQLWFRKVSNNLEVSIIGTTDKATITNWYRGSQYQVEEFKTADGHTLLDSKVQNLVNAMAAFSPPAAGQTTLSASYQAALEPVIAANWQ